MISNVCFGHFLKLEAAAIDKGARAAAHKHQWHLGGSCVGGWGRGGTVAILLMEKFLCPR